MRLFRPTLRLRMALLYGGLVILVGGSVLVTAILLVDDAIENQGSRDVLAPVHTELWKGAGYFAIIAIVGATGGYLLAKQALRPIAKLTQTAKQMSTETLDQRIDLGGPDDELRELADTFDDMLARLNAAFESQRLFVANASHELRTPLSVISTELEVTLSDPDADVEDLRRMGAVVASATERAQRLVSSLLTLARLQAVEAGELEVRERVDLAALVPGVLRTVQTEATGKKLNIDVVTEPAATLGDPRLLERLIGNLVENAIRHNVPNGWLRITTGQLADRVWLHVANGGPVIPANDVEALFEPFRRGGRVRTATRGAGLGLAIVRLIVDAHHGKLQAAAPAFGGLAIRIELPCVDAAKPGPTTARPAALSSDGSPAPDARIGAAG